MEGLDIRSAEPGDANALANLHLLCSALLSDRLENQLGLGYLAAYYRVFLAEPARLILCSELPGGQLSGLISGVTHYTDHLHYMHQKRLSLLSAAIPAVLRRPRSLAALLNLQRQPWIAGSNDATSTAARITFWCWRPQAPPAGGGVILLQSWLEAVRLRGARRVYGDVDERNPRVTAIHRSLGAQIQTQTFPDGSEQSLILYELS
jgi:hypothetical protein